VAKQDTRNKILKAAETLFSKNGFDGTPTKRIASEAGITEMTLFNHFPSKELLYKTVVKERFLAVEIESVLSELSYDDLERDLKIISLKLIDNFLNNKYILMMRLKEKKSFQNDDRFKLEQDPILKQILPVFRKYDEKGLIESSGDSGALLFIAAIKGLFHVCLLDGKGESEIQEMIGSYVTTFCHGMVKRP
jgi:AcrR family transcriptional regulator